MNSTIIVRGTAIAIVGIAASIFAAKEFIRDTPQQQAGMQQTVPKNTNGTFVGASLIGAGVGQSNEAAPDASPELRLSAGTQNSDTPVVPELTLGALDTGRTGDTAPRIDSDFRPDLALADAELHNSDTHCAPSIDVTASVDALLDLRILAPCNPSERIVISHGDLAFSAYTSGEGAFSAYLPALTATASVDAYLADGTLLQAQANVPDIAQHHRVVVQWTGDFGISLHAFHHGAAYGTSGHIHAANPFDPNMDASFIIRLGEARGPEPMLAHVYSIPAAMLEQSRMELEALHDTRSCGLDLAAYVLQISGGQQAELKEMTLAMPGCDQPQGVAVMPLPFEHARQPEPQAAEYSALSLATRQK
ncbi:hypothetical protein [Roseinatronobacter alkalisoli]|uniref:Translocase n=1 Tax=Roseinatronobacter alkalisoli TaxID=3028235 RepID=A0ABT5T7R4_9RHOB|nr:hypothetical protein [Roseinatronobacter sp. HJB301]MDD7971173.1 hypothetical protein [Roseinatronobacter sp. HJB301]